MTAQQCSVEAFAKPRAAQEAHEGLINFCVEAALSSDALAYSRAVLEGCTQLSGLSGEDRQAVQAAMTASVRRRTADDAVKAGPALLRLEGCFQAWQHFDLSEQAAG